MRIIAGKYKKTPLKTLDGTDITRPTKDMVKEAVFSSIDIYSDTYFLDLFSGSGAIGLEALSRNAKEVVFNDVNKNAVKIINENLKKVNENRLVLNLDYSECLKRLSNYKFDYIYIDPPYIFNDYDNLFSLVNEYALLNEKGKIIIETKKDNILKEEYIDMFQYKDKKYGITKVLYYKKKETL